MIFFVLLTLLHPQASAAAPLSLKDAAAYALRNSPGLDTAQRQALIAEDERLNASAAFLPSLDLTSTHGLTRTYPAASGSRYEPWASSFSLSLTETLYDNGESLTKHRIALLQEEIARESLYRSRDRLLLDVASAYFQHSVAKKALEIQQEQHAVLKLQVQLVKESYRHGVKSRKDFLRFQTQLNRSDIDLLAARVALHKAELALRRVLGVPLDSAEAFEFTVDESRPAAQRWAEGRLEAHRDSRLAALQRRVAELNSDLARRRLWPEIGVVGNATYGSSDYLNTGLRAHENDKLNWSALLTVKYNLLDWGVRRRNSEIAASRAAIRANELDTELLALREEVDKLAVDLRKLQESFQLTDELFKLERANLALITNEYRQGKVQYLDYINALQNFASSKSQYYSSLFELKRAILARRYHEGTIHEVLSNEAVQGR